jgi:hypothetical protein
MSLSKAAPDYIGQLEAHQIFVFGSNTEGRHGAGAALMAKQKWGAVYGNPKGRQGQCYAIVTKDLKQGKRSVPLAEIGTQIAELVEYAKAHPELEFLVTRIGTDLAGYTVEEIAALWKELSIPSNVRLPKLFLNAIA